MTYRVVIGVDPGVKASAVSATVDGVITQCWYVEHGRNPLIENPEICLLADAVNELPNTRAGLIEMPRARHRVGKKHRDVESINHNDLIDLAAVSGEWMTILWAIEVRTRYVYPAEWKGQITKQVTRNRLQRVLSESEWRCIVAATRGPGVNHNVVDAAGISLAASTRQIGKLVKLCKM